MAVRIYENVKLSFDNKLQLIFTSLRHLLVTGRPKLHKNAIYPSVKHIAGGEGPVKRLVKYPST